MTRPRDGSDKDPPFLSVDDAEIVQGPDVIADKVSEALRDADRFDLPSVKPPLSQALDRVERAGNTADVMKSQPGEQDALAGKAADIDGKAGSDEMLRPDPEGRPA